LIRADKFLNVAPLELGSSSGLKLGDPALVAGHKGSEAVVGVRVVQRGEFVGYWEYLLENAIYTNPPYPNYAGTALIGPDGSLLGIGSIYTRLAVAGFGSIQANMFVPIDLLKPILNDLKTTGRFLPQSLGPRQRQRQSAPQYFAGSRNQRNHLEFHRPLPAF